MRTRARPLPQRVEGVQLTPMTALATNGYFSHGYGTISKGMAGAGTALSQDSIAAAGVMRPQGSRR